MDNSSAKGKRLGVLLAVALAALLLSLGTIKTYRNSIWG